MTARQRAEHRHNVLRHRLDMRSQPPTDWQALRTGLQLQAKWLPMLAGLERPVLVEKAIVPAPMLANPFRSDEDEMVETGNILLEMLDEAQKLVSIPGVARHVTTG